MKEGGGQGEDDEEENKFDQTECIAACAYLEKDPVGRELVAKHVECANAAKDCSALLACQ